MSTFFSDTIGRVFQPYSIEHLIPIGIIILGVILIYLFRNRLKNSPHEQTIRYTLATLGLILEIARQIWVIATGNWTFPESLPLGLCMFSLILGIYVLYTKSYKVFEIAYFWSIGGVVSILFPDILYSIDRFRYYHFTISHILFFFMFMYMLFVHEYYPTNASFKKSFIALLTIVLFFVIPFNFIFEANVMYLRVPGDTPFSIFSGYGYGIYLMGTISLSIIVMIIWYSPIWLYHKLSSKE